jgi:hypothetical protein
MSGPDQNAAEISFRRAIKIARQQQAKLVELRAAICLAQLWAARRKRRQARDLLVPIYEWFTGGSTTAQLVVAKKLIDALA